MTMKTRIRPQLETLEGRTLLNAGDLDTTFGGTGRVSTQLSTVSDPSSDSTTTLVQPADGKVVVAGNVYGSHLQRQVPSLRVSYRGRPLQRRWHPRSHIRLRRSGGDDLRKQRGGNRLHRTSIRRQDRPGSRTATAWIPGKKGGGNLGPSSVEVIRLNSDGSLDTTFGGTGRVSPSTSILSGPWGESRHPVGRQDRAGGHAEYFRALRNNSW